MNQDQITQLISKFDQGLATAEDVAALEQLVESGEIDLLQFDELNKLESMMMKREDAIPSVRMDQNFYSALAKEKENQHRSRAAYSLFDWSTLFPKLALAASILLVGFAGGFFFRSPSEDRSVAQLTQQVGELKEMMMLALLEKESATERLKAVSLTSDMEQVSKRVTSALFQTLNSDENVNVRLAALDVLMNYAKDGEVRAGLIKSIAVQDSPLVQVALAELMVTLHEKRSVNELKKLLNSNKTPKEVKGKIEKSISVLI